MCAKAHTCRAETALRRTGGTPVPPEEPIMHILITAGPTREPIDEVRFITNASSGRMGYAVACAAAQAGHDVLLLSGPADLPAPPGCAVESFLSVADLKTALERHFEACGALVMAAAVGDFRPERPEGGKLRRGRGPILLRLVPTEDVVAGVAAGKRPDQVIVVFAVEDGRDKHIQARARDKLLAKNADYIVANTPGAMAAAKSRACILSADGLVLPWALRTKEKLAAEIIRLIEADR